MQFFFQSTIFSLLQLMHSSIFYFNHLVIEELPQTAPGQLHSLPHHDNRHEAVSRVLTTPDPMLVSQIVDAFATNPVEHM